MPSSGINVRERTEYRECDALVMVAPNALTADNDDDLRECGFEGDVDVSWDPEEGSVVVWTCPECDATHEEPIEDYAPEPDDER